MASLYGHLEHFDPETGNFNSYVARFEQFLCANSIKIKVNVEDTEEEIENPQVVAMFVTFVGPSTFEILEKLLVPKTITSDGVNYTNVVKLLKEHYKATTFKIFERFQFWKREQQSEESIADYVIGLKEKVKNCDFGDFYKEAMRDKFIIGLKNEQIQTKLIQQEEITFEEAIKIANSMESSKQKASSLHESTSVNKIMESYKAGARKSSDFKACYRCGRDHDPESCEAKNWRCFNCSRTGHIGRVCRERVREQSRTSKSNWRPHKSVKKLQEESSGTSSSSESEQDSISTVYEVGMVKSTRNMTFKKVLKIEKRNIEVEVDTGAGVSIIDRKLMRSNFGKEGWRRCSAKVGDVNGRALWVVGEKMVKVQYNAETFELRLVIVKLPKPVILIGRNWMDVLEPEWRRELLPKIHLVQKVEVGAAPRNTSKKEFKKMVKYPDPLSKQATRGKDIKHGDTAIKSFKRCHVNFVRLYQYSYFILVDSYSKWIEVKLMKKTRTKDVLRELEKIQTTFGVIKTMVADKETPFSYKELEEELKKKGTTLLHSPSATSESVIHTVMKSLKKSLNEMSSKRDVEEAINKFLQKYRNTPTISTGKTPAELVFAFKPDMQLRLIHKPLEMNSSQPELKPVKSFVKEEVLVKPHRDKMEITPTRSSQGRLEDRRSSGESCSKDDSSMEESWSPQRKQQEIYPICRRSERIRKEVDRYKP